jgi:O-antigen/teichoic acid export membrane protein
VSADLDSRFDLRGRSLRAHTARGSVVNALYAIGLNSLGLVKGFVVAVFLTASEYGIWGILFISYITLVWLKQVGVGDKFVQQDEPDQELAFQRAFTVEVAFSAGLFVVMLASAPLLGLVYGRSDVVAPALVLAFAVPATALSSPLWIYYRRMQFVRQRLLEGIDPVVSFVVTVVLAASGAGYWSLVIGMLAGAWAAALVAVIASPYRLRIRPDRATLRDYAGFSWPLLVASGSGIVIAQGAILAGEAELGAAGAGAIALAASIVAYAERVDQVVTSTLYPAICAVRDRTELLFESFVKSNRLALIWGVPFGVGLALFAPDLVEFGIGEEWEPAVVLIQVFGLNTAANQLGFNWGAFYRARGETRPMAVVAAITMLAFLCAPLPLLLADGLDGFAIGMAIMTAVTLAARTVYLVRLFPGFRMLPHALRAVAPTVPAAALVLGLRAVGDLDRSAALAVGELAAYAALAAAATLWLERGLLREVGSYLSGAPAAPDAVPAPGPAAAASR